MLRFQLARLPAQLACLLPLLLPTPAPAGDEPPVDIAESLPPPLVGEPADGLDGRAIYDRVLANRFHSYRQTLRMDSGDRGDHKQSVRLNLKYLSLRGDDERILSKTIARYEAPQDVRHMGYLVINKLEGPDDQFVYRPTTRRVRRVNLRGEAVFGTDFAFEDIIPKELEDGTYRRLQDAELDGRPCYAVEVTPVPDADSEYSRFVAWVDIETSVPLRKLYWDDKSVLIKELRTDPTSLKRYEDEDKNGRRSVWMPSRSRIDNLQLQSFTELEIVSLEADAKIRRRDFSERELARSH